jgi:transmembrane sensor
VNAAVVADELENGVALVLRLQSDPCPEAEEQLVGWMQAHPMLVDDLLAATIAWGSLGHLAPDPEVLRWRRQALNQARGDRRRGRYAAWAGTACASLALAIAATWPMIHAPAEARVYVTQPGQRVELKLQDGSVVKLDADSAISVALTKKERRLELTRGQASFSVSRDPNRPFLVRAGSHQVKALGTSFNVDLGQRMVVSLLEGAVVVAPVTVGKTWLGRPQAIVEPAAAIRMAAGQELVVEPNNRRTLQAANSLKVLAWEQGMIVLENEELSTAVGRINRYARDKIELRTANGERRVSGVFKAGDPEAFLDAVDSFYPSLEITRPGLNRIVITDATVRKSG